MAQSDLHSAWARLFVSSLVSAKVVDVVCSPGSRSTPLALAVAQESRLTLHVLIDERVAGFFAIGQARVSGRPSVLLCTSGTAGAHYLPAVIEASQSHLPVLIVTADRPWEDYDCAAAQTIDQVKLFGSFVRHYAELGLPDASPAALQAVVRIAAQAVAATRSPVPGPVHINARFRKPLEPTPTTEKESYAVEIERLLKRGPATVFLGSQSPNPAAVQAVVQLCVTYPQGVIVAGPAAAGRDDTALRHAVGELSRRTGFPIWAEATSGLRFGNQEAVCGGFDALLQSPSFRKSLVPQLLIELGGPVVSSGYARWVAEHPDCVRVVIAEHGWNDPQGSASLLCRSDPATFATALLTELSVHAPEHPKDRSWEAQLGWAEQQVWQVVNTDLSDGDFSEGVVARAVVSALPADSVLMVGNSLPVRDLDLFCPPNQTPLRVLHQRGASGIDGLIAGAAGARSQTDQPLLLLLGDVSAAHDLGGLAALQKVRGPLVTVIVNNSGGRIFEQLPIGKSHAAESHFSQLFLTPPQLDFGHAAAAFGIPFVKVDRAQQLHEALASGLTSQTPLIIEALVPGADGAARRQRIWQTIATRIPACDLASTPLAESGSAPPPHVYLHGFLGSPALWEGTAKQTHLPCYHEYLPGHGPEPWTLPDADFWTVIDALCKRIPFPRFALFGYSLGARLALALALRHPDRVSSLVLVGVDPGIASQEDRSARQAWEDSLSEQLTTRGLAAFVTQWEALPLFDSQKRLPESIRSRQRAERLHHKESAIAWSLRTLGTGRMPDLWPLIPSLRVPTQVISGALDAKCTEIGKRLCSLSPFFMQHIIPDSGHNPVLETPERLLSLLTTLFPSHYGVRKP
jgi:2-succinyl-5-enolpyruvyl-6-hydroxy-3-cyclohexene-1-carboxylate synthase